MRFFATLMAHRRLVLAAWLVVTATLALFASRVRFDNSIEVWFLDDDPGLVTYQEFLERFEADEITVVGLFARDVFHPEVLAALDRITRAAARAPYVHRARSLANLDVALGENGVVEIGPLMPHPPETSAEADVLRRRVHDSSLLSALVAKDDSAVAVLVEMSPEGQDFDRKVSMVRALREIAVREAPAGVKVALAGTAPWDEAFYLNTQRDFTLFGPLTLVMVLAAIYLVFRRLSAVLVPVAVVVTSLVWLFGLLGILGRKIDVVTSALPPVILAVGVADAVHMVAEYYAHLARAGDRQAAAVQSLKTLLVPCFFTSATTAAGMLSLMSSDLFPVRQFGWQSALGVCLAFLLSITLAPVLLVYARPPDPAFLARQAHGPLALCLAWLGRSSRARSGVVAAAGVVAVGLSVLAATRIEVGANAMNYFREDDPVRQDTAAVDAALGGSATVEVMVTTPAGGLKDPAALARMEALQESLEQFPGVSLTLSVVDQLKEINRALNDGVAGALRLPQRRDLIAQFYLLLEGGDDFAAWMQDDYAVGRITGFVRMSEAQDLAHRIGEVETMLREGSDHALRTELTGYIKLMGDMEVYLLDSQLRSFAIAFVVVVLMLMALLRSVRLGLFAMIPNLTPIIMGLGFMAAVGIPLDPGTVMIGSIALGLVVDDTVHFLVRLRRHLSAGADMEQAIRATLVDAGRPIMVTSLVLAGGFVILAAASFTPNIHFGIVTTVVILLALIADLMLLPASLLLLRPKLRLRR